MSNYIINGVDLEALQRCEIKLFLEDISSNNELLEQVRKLPAKGALYDDDFVIEKINYLKENYDEKSPEIKILSYLERLGPYLCLKAFGVGVDTNFTIDGIVYSTRVYVSEQYAGFDSLEDITIGVANALLLEGCNYAAKKYVDAINKKESNKN